MTLATACPKPQRVEKARKYLPRSTTPLRSDFHKQLRSWAYTLSNGRCECDECRMWRLTWDERKPWRVTDAAAISKAFSVIPIWFVQRGGAAYKRFRSTEGELHHDSYKYFGDENPAELAHVRWVWKDCHKRIEAEKGTRNRYVRGLKK